MVNGALYALSFYRGIRLFIYHRDSDIFLQSGQKNILKSKLGGYKISECDTWRFHELNKDTNGAFVTLRLATEEEQRIWNEYWPAPPVPNPVNTNHYQIY